MSIDSMVARSESHGRVLGAQLRNTNMYAIGGMSNTAFTVVCSIAGFTFTGAIRGRRDTRFVLAAQRL